ncbi:MAG: hypothetical protein WC797_01355 [Candidatus Paceibacterota bacterium]
MVCSEMRKQALRAGLQMEFTDDKGDYATRMKKFADGEYEMVMMPINSYLQHGQAHKYPGVIVMAIAESRGADGIVCRAGKLIKGKKGITANDLNDPALRFVYTGESPSEFLMDQAISGFGLDNLKSTDVWRIKVAGSSEVYQKAKDGQGDVFILWEPDLSKALALPGMQYVYGSDKISHCIVDVLIVRREFIASHLASVSSLLRTYFKVMASYATDKERLIKEMSLSTNLPTDVVAGTLKKIDWFGLRENCAGQFGIGDTASEGVINTIWTCTDTPSSTAQFWKGFQDQA